MQCSLFDKRQKTSTKFDIVASVTGTNALAQQSRFLRAFSVVLQRKDITKLWLLVFAINRKSLLQNSKFITGLHQRLSGQDRLSEIND